MHSSVKYSVIVACYRSSEWLEELVDRVVTVLTTTDHPFEILLVNDASPDGNWSVIEQIAARHPQVRGIDLMFNTGQFRAAICGMEHAVGDLIITMDDDLQHPPEQLPVLIGAMESRPDPDCVMGRYAHKHHSPIRRLGSRLADRMHKWLHGKPRDLQMTSFRILRCELARAICAHRTAIPILGPLLLKSTRRIENVTVEHHPRPHSGSNYSIARLASIVVDNIVASSTLPLKAVGLLGLLSTVLSVLFGAFHLYRYLTGEIRPGFTTTVLLITFFGGATLIAIGILGEYVSRIVHEVARPPRYGVRCSTADPEGEE